MPLYVCATSSLPIGASFLLSGMSGGAVFVFLSAGPATNSVTMSVVFKTLGKKLNFEDSYFDGYWSLGVIEHFIKGYDDIIEEEKYLFNEYGFEMKDVQSYISKIVVDYMKKILGE